MTTTPQSRHYFHNWNLFEITLLLSSVLIMIILSIVWQETWIGLISGTTGILAVVLCAKGKSSTFFFASISVALYAYISYENKLYGEVMLNALYYLPMNVVGFLLWKNHQSETGQVLAKLLSPVQVILLACGTLIAMAAYYQLLIALGGNLAVLDTMTTVLSVIALILQVTRFSAQWILWILVNIIAIVKWSFLLQEGDPSAGTMLVMWSAYLINAIYGYYHWRALTHQQKRAYV